MCGITGILSNNGGEMELHSHQLATMLNAIRHRGPDGPGLWNDQRSYASLAHCRLAIIDLSPQGQQPMADAGNLHVIVFNGEIYNYLELRRELELEGVSFRGRSDTEVLLSGLCRWGVDKALRSMVGMFAFAFWDARQRVLHLARDRAGKKPLYYHTDGDCFYFASEIKAFQRVKDLQHNRESLYHYLSLGFVPAPATIYKNVLEVLPGHRLEVDAELGVHDHEYWNLMHARQNSFSLEEAAEEAEAKLVEAVKIRLRRDVPVGTFLSGAPDSRLIHHIAP